MATRSVVCLMVRGTACSNGIASQGYFFLNKLIKLFASYGKKSTDVSQSEGIKKKRGKERNAMLKPAEQWAGSARWTELCFMPAFCIQNCESHPSLSPHPTWYGLRFLLARRWLMKSNPFCNNNIIQSTWGMVFAGLQFSWELRAWAWKPVICLLTWQEKHFYFPKFSFKICKAYWLFSGVYFHFGKVIEVCISTSIRVEHFLTNKESTSQSFCSSGFLTIPMQS